MSHPVLSVIAQRVAAASRPGERTDGHRVALVVEGGGMRGIVSAAMAAAIEDLGLLDAFDLAVGTSAGALNAAALLAGVAGGCTHEYADGFTARGFINPARVLLGRPVVDVEYVIDFNSQRLDAGRHARTAASPIPLHCVATDVDTCAAADLTGLTELPDLRSALLATSRLPWLGGDPVGYRGRRWLDGGLAEPVAVPTALAAGATHVLVLMTRSRGGVMTNGGGGGLGDRLLERRLRALNPDLVDLYRRRAAGYAELTEGILSATDAPGSAPPYLMGIALNAGDPVPSRLDRSPTRLRGAATLAHRVATQALTPR